MCVTWHFSLLSNVLFMQAVKPIKTLAGFRLELICCNIHDQLVSKVEHDANVDDRCTLQLRVNAVATYLDPY
jgi:hypothetical protein